MNLLGIHADVPAGETATVTLNTDGVGAGEIRITGFRVPKDVSEEFNIAKMKIGELDILLAKVPAAMFFVPEKSRLELLAEELEELLKKVTIPWTEDGLSTSARLAAKAVNALPQLLDLVPRTIGPPPFDYFVPKGAAIVIEVENTSDVTKCFRCSFMVEER